MAYNAAEIRQVLLVKLAAEDEPKKRHECYRVYRDGKLIAQTFMSRGAGNTTIGDTLLRLMAKQLGVSLKEFKLFCDCTTDRETFLELIGPSTE